MRPALPSNFRSIQTDPHRFLSAVNFFVDSSRIYSLNKKKNNIGLIRVVSNHGWKFAKPARLDHLWVGARIP